MRRRFIRGSDPWSITDALKWRRQHEPSVTDQAALAELIEVCRRGKVAILGTRRSANPYWPEDRKAAVWVAVLLEKSEESNVPAAEFEDLYFEMNNNYHGGTLNWKTSRAVAWWPVAFASDELVIAWLGFIALSHIDSPAETKDIEYLRGSSAAIQSDPEKPSDIAEMNPIAGSVAPAAHIIGEKIQGKCIPQPDWITLAEARRRALAHFDDAPQNTVEQALINALWDGKIRTQGRCKTWFRHNERVTLGKYVWDPGQLRIAWESNGFARFSDENA